MIKRFFSSLLGLLTAFAGWSQSPQLPDDPRQLTIYQVMVASFIHGEGGAEGYTRMWGPDGHTKNGNLRGIIQSLDHIQSLGCNAIWMTPIFDSSLTPCEEKLKATGYFTNNYFAIDPHFGTEAELRELIDEAHRRGIAVIFDGVFGHHGGITEPSPTGLMPESEGAQCDRPNGAGTNVAFPASLPYMTEVATYWIDQFGIDGWRLDVAPQLLQGGHNYWVEVRRSVERLCAERRQHGETVGILGYMVGEDWTSAGNITVTQQDGLKSVMDFDGKDELMQKVSQNGTLMQQMAMYQQMALQLASQVDPMLAEQLAQGIMTGAAAAQSAQGGGMLPTGDDGGMGGAMTKLGNARAQAAQAAQPGV